MDTSYTQITPWNSNPRSLANTYFFQFRLQGLPLTVAAGTSMVVPEGMLKFHASSGQFGTNWNTFKTDGLQWRKSYRARAGRFWRNKTSYGHYRWVLVCVAGSTIQDAKYRLAPEYYNLHGSDGYSARYIAAPLSRFRSHLKNSSDATCKAIMGNYSNRGYGGPFWQGDITWSQGTFNIQGGFVNAQFYGYQLDLSFMGAPGKFIEWRRQ